MPAATRIGHTTWSTNVMINLLCARIAKIPTNTVLSILLPTVLGGPHIQVCPRMIPQIQQFFSPVKPKSDCFGIAKTEGAYTQYKALE